MDNKEEYRRFIEALKAKEKEQTNKENTKLFEDLVQIEREASFVQSQEKSQAKLANATLALAAFGMIGSFLTAIFD